MAEEGNREAEAAQGRSFEEIAVRLRREPMRCPFRNGDVKEGPGGER